ncbi:MAG: N-acetylglucosamine-6-phosphate deacetylase, partial [Acidimicrobiia bacterium]|nr:N-acetylglucosamine-6-phosphate deacetylase [Acidimicrobiia bacterium]
MKTTPGGGIVLRSERVMLPGGWAAAEVACTAGRINTIDPIGTHDRAIDVGAAALVPGYVDVQINGGYGHDFSATPGTIWDVGSRLPVTGVTAFLPTIVTGPETAVQAALAVVADGPADYSGSEVIGLHLEGPVLSPDNAGAHDPSYLSTVIPMDTWLDPRVRLVTLAPELVDAAVIGELASNGVVVAIGHTNGTFDDAVHAFAAGARHVTHLFNAMPPIHHRSPGPVVAALLNPSITVGVIPDGIHVHPAVLELVARSVGPGRLVALTDAIAGMGMPPGEYRVGPLTAYSDGLAMRLPDGTYAGSILTMDRAVRFLIEEVGLTPFDAITSASTTPAALIGDAERGSIRPGARADFVILD